MSDSGSSDESLKAMRRKGRERFHNGGVAFGRGGGENREFCRNGEFECEKKRSRTDLFEFDEYDEFEGANVRNDHVDGDGRLKMAGRNSGASRDFGGSSSRKDMMVEKRKHSFLDGPSSAGSGRSKRAEYGGGVSKFDLDEDEAHLPNSLLSLKYQEMPEEPIRLQGKNGVLKVMVNKKKKMDVSRDDHNREHVEKRKGSRTDVVKKELELRLPFNSELKRTEKQISIEREKNECKMSKPLLGNTCMDDDFDLDETDTSLKLAPPSFHAICSSKVRKEERSSTENLISLRVKEEKRLLTESITPHRGKEEKKTPAGSSTPASGKEGKVKRGGSTEKQQLREKIREMLLKAGWTIDYRPRRNRDYLDAVYINPSGTAYWSIIKAYDALQKQLNDQQGKSKSDGNSSFAPLSEDLICKLTRQTRKKIEEEMKKKRRQDGMAKTGKRAAIKSIEGTDSDQPEETLSSYMRQNRKSSKDKMNDESGNDSSDNSCRRTRREDRVEKSSHAANNNVVQGRKSRITGRCTLLVRSSDKGQNPESDGYVPYTGKRTVLAWLIDSGTVQLSEKVQYMNRRRTRVKLEGWITREGIHCGCCSKILTVSKFELHAGSKLRQPFQNIFLESGVSLLQCQIDAWNKQEESERQDFYTIDMDGDDPDDDTCGICGDGGDLICCDSCPSTFHQSCLGIQMLPLGDWHCHNCVCEFCGTASRIVVEGADLPFDELTMCSLCERKYHTLCSKENGAPPVDSNNLATHFCGQKCQELYDHLQKILGVRHELEAGFSWSVIQRTDIDRDVANRGSAQRAECNSKLAVALSIMDECFLPIVDRRSGINLIHNVLYNCGANFRRLNYRGFYTAILERGDEIISAASIRIHGTQLAEMPFIGTRHIYRRQGMCRRLLSAIESVLSSLKVEKLIIPAISEHMHTWTVVFGFNPLEEYLKKEMKFMNMLVFPGTDMLQKHIMKQAVTDGVKAVESTDCQNRLPPLTRKTSNNSSAEHDGHVGKDGKVILSNKKVDKVDLDSCSPDSAAPSKTTSSSGPRTLDSTSKSDTCLAITGTALTQSKQVAELSSDMKASSLSAATVSLLDVEKAVPDSLDKDHAKSPMEAETGDPPKGTGESSEQVVCEAANDNQTSIAQNIVEIKSKFHVGSDVTSDAEIVPSEGLIHSAPCEVNMSDCDTAGAYLGTVQPKKAIEENGCASPSRCGRGEPSVTSSSDLNKPSGVNVQDEPDLPSEHVSDAETAIDAEVAIVEGNNDASVVQEVGDDDSNDAEASCFRPAPISLDENASQIINEKKNFCSSPSEGATNSESHVKMAEVKNESADVSELGCDVNAVSRSNKCVLAIPNSYVNVCSPHGTGELSKNQEALSESTSLLSTKKSMSSYPDILQPAILEKEGDLVTLKAVSNEGGDQVEATIQSNGEGMVITNEAAPVEASVESYGEGKLSKLSEVCDQSPMDATNEKLTI